MHAKSVTFFAYINTVHEHRCEEGKNALESVKRRWMTERGGVDILPDRLSGTEWPLIEALLKEGRGVTVFHLSRVEEQAQILTHIYPREVPGRRLAIKETEISRRSGVPVSFVNTADYEEIPAGTAKLARKQKMYPPYL